jgi:chlorobactene glucosyltransferase
MEVYQVVILGVLLIMGTIALVNLITFRSVPAEPGPHHGPRVSVLIPARNEARNIPLCLATLVEQRYADFEVLVLDDDSHDGTGAIVAAWAARDPRVRLIRGESLPPGWTGKNFACHQLSQHATGDILLFVDADTSFDPRCLSSSVAAMEEHRADLLSLIPYQHMKTFWELTVLPLLHFVTFAFLPFPLVSISANPKFAMATGQFMMFRQEAYRTIGGHESVRSAIVEDVWLARRIKGKGLRLRVLGGERVVSCRMYRSFREIWEGFSKNLFPGFRYSVPGLVVTVGLLITTSILPVLFLGFALANQPADLRWIVMQLVILLAVRLILAVRFRTGILSSFLHPLGMGVVVGMAVNSSLWVLVGSGSRWKGRAYTFPRSLAVDHGARKP